jgi:hypothetical protein
MHNIEHSHGRINSDATIFVGVKVVVFNATFNNISVVKWRSVLLVVYPEKTASH